MANVMNLINAISKLRWSAEGEWSASVTPEECKALLAVLPDNIVSSHGGKDDRDMSHSQLEIDDVGTEPGNPSTSED